MSINQKKHIEGRWHGTSMCFFPEMTSPPSVATCDDTISSEKRQLIFCTNCQLTKSKIIFGGKINDK